MRKGFSLITAIFTIVIMTTVSMLVFDMAGKIVKGTTIQFKKEQAMLLTKSYTEYAIMAIINYDRAASTNCIENINAEINSLEAGVTPSAGVTAINGGGYKVETKIYYIGNDLPCHNNVKLNDSTDATRSTTRITTNYGRAGKADAISAVIIDVYVKYKDPSAIDPENSPWITYFRRTLQKI